MKEPYELAMDQLQAGDWDAAHRTIQVLSDPLACEIHGLLHRIEGDIGNAQYWYGRAGQPYLDNSIDEEIARIKKLIEDSIG